MTSTITPSTSRASFAIGNEQTARRVVDRLNESFFEGQAAIAAFERSDGRWDVTMHFAEAPDQTSIRELVGIAAGGDIAQGHTGRTRPGPRGAIHRARPS
jgi:ribosomal protein L11 methyltransferase